MINETEQWLVAHGARRLPASPGDRLMGWGETVNGQHQLAWLKRPEYREQWFLWGNSIPDWAVNMVRDMAQDGSPVLQAIMLAEVLFEPSKLKDVDPRRFAGRYRQIIDALMQSPPDTSKLKAWLAEHGCEWSGEVRAIDAIRQQAAKDAQNQRAREVTKKARYLNGTPEGVARQLERLIDSLELSE